MADLIDETRVAAPSARPGLARDGINPGTGAASSSSGAGVAGAHLSETVVSPLRLAGGRALPRQDPMATVVAATAQPKALAKSKSAINALIATGMTLLIAAGGGYWLAMNQHWLGKETPQPVQNAPLSPSPSVPPPQPLPQQPAENADDLYARSDYAKALEKYQQTAEQGDRRTQYLVGYMYQNGQGVPPDYGRALSWYRRAAGQGDAAAESQIGFLYLNGLGVPRDPVVAGDWFAKAAIHGSREGQYQSR